MEQADVVASTLLEQFDRVDDKPPYFWSDQHGRRIQLAGRPGANDEFRIVEGDTGISSFAAVYTHADRITAALAVDRPRTFGRLRRQLAG